MVLALAETQILTYRYHVKDKHAASLNRMARAVNFVWNYCNNAQKHALKHNTKWRSGFDLNYLTIGSSKLLGLHSGIINATCEQYANSRFQRRRPYLRYRGKNSLGWVPFKGRDIKALASGFRLARKDYAVWLSRPLPNGAKIVDGSSFSCDTRGRWYINIRVQVYVAEKRAMASAVGIDLGLKAFATLSTGEKIAAPQFYRKSQEKLAKAQRAKKKRLARRIQAKAANQRRDFLHKLSTNIVLQHDFIAAGNVSASKLARTNMAKSVLDAGWSSFRHMLRYKAIAHGAVYREVNEVFTTQTCSACYARSGPKGRKGLGVREWQCCECGAVHDRDLNSSINILRCGHATPLVGTLAA